MSDQLDLANLGTQAIDEGDGVYETASEFYRPPDPGKETIILKEVPGEERFYPVKDFDSQQILPGFSTNLHFVIQGGAQDGAEFFAFIDTRKKPNRNGNDVKDYILAMTAAGQSIPPVTTVEEYKNAIQNYIAPVEAKLTWSGAKCECGAKRLKLKAFDFKKDSLGNNTSIREHVTKCQDCGEKVGAQVKISAFLVPSAA